MLSSLGSRFELTPHHSEGYRQLPESFTIDHTKLNPPYVRIAKVIPIFHPKAPLNEPAIFKYDLRFARPNKERIPAKAMHTVEHLMSVTLREAFQDFVDFSPMGCQTGFYFTVIHNLEHSEVLDRIARAALAALSFSSIPGSSTPKECGSYRFHSLRLAKKWLLVFISARDKWDTVFLEP